VGEVAKTMRAAYAKLGVTDAASLSGPFSKPDPLRGRTPGGVLIWVLIAPA
jgi:hypothetical protein